MACLPMRSSSPISSGRASTQPVLPALSYPMCAPRARLLRQLAPPRSSSAGAGRKTMAQTPRLSFAALGFVGFGLCAPELAGAACQLVTATASEASPAAAARSSQALVVQSANQLKRARVWAYLTLYAHKVKGDPFWKAVRPNGV